MAATTRHTSSSFGSPTSWYRVDSANDFSQRGPLLDAIGRLAPLERIDVDPCDMGVGPPPELAPSHPLEHEGKRRAIFIDVVVEGMEMFENGVGKGYHVPLELVDCLRTLGDQMDGLGEDLGQAQSSQTKSLRSALESAMKRPGGDPSGVVNQLIELIKTEQSYLQRLNTLQQYYAAPLRKYSRGKATRIVDQFDTNTMFGKVDAILECTKSVAAALDRIGRELVAANNNLSLLNERCNWAEAIRLQMDSLRNPYRAYLEGYELAKETEQRLTKSDPGFRQFCERIKQSTHDDRRMGRVGLRELLMEPVQRITRYVMMLEQLLSKTDTEDPNRPQLLAAIVTCHAIARCEIDPATQRAATLWAFSRVLEKFPPIMINDRRSFVDSLDVVDIVGNEALPCTLFLFNDTMVIAKKQSGHHAPGRSLVGLDNTQILVSAMKKASGISNSLGRPTTPSKIKKGSMTFKGAVDVHDVSAAELTHNSEVAIKMTLHRPPPLSEVSARWAGRPERTFILPAHASLAGKRKALHDRKRFLQSLWRTKAMVKGNNTLNQDAPKSLVVVSHWSPAVPHTGDVLDSGSTSESCTTSTSQDLAKPYVCNPDVTEVFWNLYDRQTFLAEPRKHKAVLQLQGPGRAEQLSVGPDGFAPQVVFQALFNDDRDPHCTLAIKTGSRSEDRNSMVLPVNDLAALIVRAVAEIKFTDENGFSKVNVPANSTNPEGKLPKGSGMDSLAQKLVFGSTNLTRAASKLSKSSSSSAARASVFSGTTASTMPSDLEDAFGHAPPKDRHVRTLSTASCFDICEVIERPGDAGEDAEVPRSKSTLSIESSQFSSEEHSQNVFPAQMNSTSVPNAFNVDSEESERVVVATPDGKFGHYSQHSVGSDTRKPLGPRRQATTQSPILHKSFVTKSQDIVSRQTSNSSSFNENSPNHVGKRSRDDEEEEIYSAEERRSSKRSARESLQPLPDATNVPDHFRHDRVSNEGLSNKNSVTPTSSKQDDNSPSSTLEALRVDVEAMRQDVLELGANIEIALKWIHNKFDTTDSSKISALPRSPRKNQLNLRGSSPSLESVALNNDSDDTCLQIESILSNAQTLLQKLQRCTPTQQVQQDLASSRSNVIQLKFENETLKKVRSDLEHENGLLYEAFNEELDCLFEDVNLPEHEAVLKLLDELRKCKVETKNWNAKYMQSMRDLSVAQAHVTSVDSRLQQADLYEAMLREAGML